jgi:hypothetical protein
MQIRQRVLDQLSENSLPSSAPYSSLEEVLVPMYLFHRYQVEAVSKIVGGIEYNYAVKGGNQEIQSWLPKELQMKALDALLNTIDPEQLKLSEELLMKIPPKAHGYRRNRETFASNTGPVFDYYTAMATASQLTFSFLLDTHRANRLVMYQHMNPNQPGLEKVLQEILDKVINIKPKDEVSAGIKRILLDQLTDHLIRLASDKDAFPDTKSLAYFSLMRIKNLAGGLSPINNAHTALLQRKIDLWLEDPEEVEYIEPIKAPDGSPIGSDQLHYLTDYCNFDY